jgi:hypothetical protein
MYHKVFVSCRLVRYQKNTKTARGNLNEERELNYFTLG